ncbi:MAG: DUF1559 domain-containing protein, partial [Planctomycetaceae bacterium]|nr:DUF1559 domain-containing protein [Planctomycetaceae bacterium]
MKKTHALLRRSQWYSVRQRSGFTILELLVTITIIAVIMSLTLPAIMNSRASAQRLECQNHMRNVTLGVLSFESTSNGYYPSVMSPRDGRLAPWTTEILPHVEAQSVYERLDLSQPPDHRISVFVCPSDEVNLSESRGLSYVVNVGYGLMT